MIPAWNFQEDLHLFSLTPLKINVYFLNFYPLEFHQCFTLPPLNFPLMSSTRRLRILFWKIPKSLITSCTLIFDYFYLNFEIFLFFSRIRKISNLQDMTLLDVLDLHGNKVEFFKISNFILKPVFQPCDIIITIWVLKTFIKKIHFREIPHIVLNVKFVCFSSVRFIYLLIYECLPRKASSSLMNCYQWESCFSWEISTKESYGISSDYQFLPAKVSQRDWTRDL